MLDRPHALFRPRWARLYGIVAITIGLVTALELLPLAALAREVAELAVVVASFAAMLGWVRSNRVAIAASDWPARSGMSVQVRVVGGTRSPSRRPRRSTRRSSQPS